MLLAAGAAAGVSAAFDAPVAGALFAVEFVLKSSRLGLDRLSTSTVFVSTSVAAGVIGFLRWVLRAECWALEITALGGGSQYGGITIDKLGHGCSEASANRVLAAQGQGPGSRVHWRRQSPGGTYPLLQHAAQPHLGRGGGGRVVGPA